MNKVNYSKIIKAIGVVAVIALIFLYFENNNRKSNQEKEKILSGLISISEDLRELSIYAEDSLNYDYEDMGISLYHLQEECEKLSRQAENLYNLKFFEEYEPEENNRSWFY